MAAAVGLAVGLAGACGGSAQTLLLDPARYATTCAAAADCVPAFVGNACAPCPCPNTAISRSSLPLLQSDLAGLRPFCADPGGIACAGCQASEAVCDAGRCALELR